jgi:hypothetical protein
MGEGGTNGKDSRIESARVEVAERAEEPDILLVSKPCACACAWAWARARCCCSCRELALAGGVTSLPMVVLRGTAVPVGLEAIATLVALLILITEPACVATLEGRLSTLEFDEGGIKP